MSAHPLVMGFLAFLATEQSASQKTITSYKLDLTQYFASCAGQKVKPQKAKHTHVRQFVLELQERGLMESSRRRKLAAVKSFYQYLFLTEQIKDNPSHSVKVRSKRQRLPKVLAPAEVELLLRAAVGRDFMIRDRALLEFFYATGARAAEVEALNLDSFDWEACEVRVLGKGDKERIVPLHPRSLTWFLRYLPQRKRLIGDNPERAFFVNYRGERLSTQMMRVLVRNYARKAGIPRHVHPHMLRHSIATHLLKNGADIKSVQELLGHESLATTQVYLHLDAKDLARTIAQHHPHSKRV